MLYFLIWKDNIIKNQTIFCNISTAFEIFSKEYPNLYSKKPPDFNFWQFSGLGYIDISPMHEIFNNHRNPTFIILVGFTPIPWSFIVQGCTNLPLLWFLILKILNNRKPWSLLHAHSRIHLNPELTGGLPQFHVSLHLFLWQETSKEYRTRNHPKLQISLLFPII